jgi:hypothetical protein
MVRELDVRTLTASEAIRLFAVFVRIESMAAGTYTVDDPDPAGQEALKLAAPPCHHPSDR